MRVSELLQSPAKLDHCLHWRAVKIGTREKIRSQPVFGTALLHHLDIEGEGKLSVEKYLASLKAADRARNYIFVAIGYSESPQR
jgi:hypothetical protein